jgi:mannitol/fructose-specific phosphotransferase system IIA component
MIQLTPQNVRIGARAANKNEAIRAAGQVLVESGFIEPAYIESMIGREGQTNTYLGKGISIPHGMAKDRELIRATGVSVIQVPEGVEWGPGEVAYLIVGIAAKSTEHLGVLAALTDVLDDPAKIALLAKTKDPNEIIAGLSCEVAEMSPPELSKDISPSPSTHHGEVIPGSAAMPAPIAEVETPMTKAEPGGGATKVSASLGTLDVFADGPLTLSPRIQVKDEAYNLVGKGFGSLNKRLPLGLYLIEVEGLAEPYKRPVLIQPGKIERVTYPAERIAKLESAAPVNQSIGQHEYVRYPVAELSRMQPTSSVFTAGNGARLVLTAQYIEGNAAPQPPLMPFALHDAKGTPLLELQNESHLFATGNTNAVRCAVDIDPGGYILEWKRRSHSEERLLQPLWLQPDHCLLLFSFADPQTRLPNASLSIYMAHRDQGFRPYEEETGLVELALRSLLTRRQLLSAQQIESLLSAKHLDPMLGLLGAHVLLERSDKKLELVDTVLRMLSELLPGHPDVLALSCRFHRVKRRLQMNPRPVGWPPMIERGLRALLDSDWTHPGKFIERGSMLDQMRTRFMAGEVWTGWSAAAGEVWTGWSAAAGEGVAPTPQDFLTILSSTQQTQPPTQLTAIPTTSVVKSLMSDYDAFSSSFRSASKEPGRSSLSVSALRATGLNKLQAASVIRHLRRKS